MNLSPQRKKERTLESLLGLLEDLSRKRPVLMLFEDVHWIDPTSRELLDLTIERIRRLPVLLIITFRPEFSEAWSGSGASERIAAQSARRRRRRHIVGNCGWETSAQ